MAVVTTERTESAAAPTGLESLDVRKLGMWIFLGSECVFFGSLITTFFVYRPAILAGERLKIRVSGGFNMPGFQVVSLSFSYLLGQDR